MRIPGSSLSKTGSRRSEKTDGVKNGNRPDPSVASPSGPEDRVAMGIHGALISQAGQVDSAGRSELVSELKSALESGSYHADPAEVSRALIDEALTPQDR